MPPRIDPWSAAAARSLSDRAPPVSRDFSPKRWAKASELLSLWQQVITLRMLLVYECYPWSPADESEKTRARAKIDEIDAAVLELASRQTKKLRRLLEKKRDEADVGRVKAEFIRVLNLRARLGGTTEELFVSHLEEVRRELAQFKDNPYLVWALLAHDKVAKGGQKGDGGGIMTQANNATAIFFGVERRTVEGFTPDELKVKPKRGRRPTGH